MSSSVPSESVQPSPVVASPLSIVGAVGALLTPVAVGAAASYYMGEDMELLGMPIVIMLLLGVCHALVSAGMTAAKSHTGAMATVASVFHILATLAFVAPVIIMMKMKSDGFDKGTVAILWISMYSLSGLAWLFTGIWGLGASRAVGSAIGITTGLLSLLGGLGLLTVVALTVTETLHRPQFPMPFAIAVGVIGLGAIMLGVALIRAPKKAA